MAKSEGESNLTVDSLVEEVQGLLRSIRLREEAGTPQYLSELTDALEGTFPVEPREFLQHMEKYGYLVVDRANGLVGVSRDGMLVASGDKLEAIKGDLAHHYEDRLSPPRPRQRPDHALVDGRYRRFGVIGSGAIATVFRGESVATRRPVAIKELREIFAYFTASQKAEIVRRLERVVAEHARINHPNVVQILDQAPGREHPYFVTELAPGGSLRRLVALERPVPPGLVCAYFIQVCHGLKSAHALGTVHRSIKPENVLLDVHGNAKLGDFGVSSIVDRGPGQSGHVFVGMGSVGYMAPEQFRDARMADSRTDIYSLGILLYELCTGRLPGRRSPMPSSVRDDLPKGLDDIFDRMTQDDPDERYPLVEAILDDLYRIDGIWELLDKRSAILMHRGPFSELDLAPLDFESIEAQAEVHAPAAAAAAAGYPGDPAQERLDAPGTVPTAVTDEPPLPLEGEQVVPITPTGDGPEVGVSATGSADYDVGGGDPSADQSADVGPGGDPARPSSSPPPRQESPDHTPEPVMPRRRFGVPPRRK